MVFSSRLGRQWGNERPSDLAAMLTERVSFVRSTGVTSAGWDDRVHRSVVDPHTRHRLPRELARTSRPRKRRPANRNNLPGLAGEILADDALDPLEPGVPAQ